MSFCITVTRLAWIAHKLASSNKWTRKASAASCSAKIAWLCQRKPTPSSNSERMKSVATSRTWKPIKKIFTLKDGFLLNGQREACESTSQSSFDSDEFHEWQLFLVGSDDESFDHQPTVDPDESVDAFQSDRNEQRSLGDRRAGFWKLDVCWEFEGHWNWEDWSGAVSLHC